MDGSVITPDVWVAAAAGLPTLARSYSCMISSMNASRHSETVTLRLLVFVAVWNDRGDAVRTLLQSASCKRVLQAVLKGLALRGHHGSSAVNAPLLACAARQNSVDAAAVLLSVKARVDVRDFTAKTPLHWAAFRGHAAAATLLLLLSAKANVHARDSWSETPLHKAASCGRVAVATLLLSAKAYVFVHDHRLETPLTKAALHGCPIVVGMLLEAGADVEARCERGETALTYAAVSPCYTFGVYRQRHIPAVVKVVSRLIEARADVDTRDNMGITPVHAAAHTVQVLRILLQARAQVNIPEQWGRTPLTYAISNRNVGAVRNLLRIKVAPNMPDGAAQAMRDAIGGVMLDRKTHDHIFQLLLRAKVDP
jgi:ankyrin repeat protein